MIANYVMSGRMQAVLTAALFALLSLLLPPLVIVSSAVVGLITLRLGGKRGWEVMFLATAVGAVSGWLIWGSVATAIATLVVWLPLFVLALVLRFTGSLAISVQAAMLLGVVPPLVEVYYFSSSDSDWQSLLEPLKASLEKAQLVAPSESQKLLDWMALWLTALFAAGLVLQTCLALFLARHWQARLYNPGGFAKEFRGLRSSKRVAFLAAAVLMVFLFLGGENWLVVRVALMVLIVLFFLQGLAVLHGLLNKSGASEMWLIGIYLLLLFALPYMAMTLAATGYADAWWDFRRIDDSDRSNGAGDTGQND